MKGELEGVERVWIVNRRGGGNKGNTYVYFVHM